MKILIMYKRYVTLVCYACMRGVRFVRNVFKKKSCGASPDTAKFIKVSGDYLIIKTSDPKAAQRPNFYSELFIKLMKG